MKTLPQVPEFRHVTSAARVALLVSAVAGLLAGCASGPESHAVATPPPAAPVTVAPANGAATGSAPVVVTTPPANGQSTVIVTQAPPVPQQEVVPPRPSGDYAWVAGYWAWSDSNYIWVAGHWEIPPRSGATWIPPRWQPEGDHYRFYEGFWD